MFLAVLSLLPAIPHIVLGVEHLFGQGKGSIKKQAAMSSVADMVNILSQLPNQTGKGADSSMMSYLDSLIESTVTYLNETGVMTHQTK